MGVREQFAKVQQNVAMRVGQTNVVYRDLTRIFNATKACDHTNLTDSDLRTLGITLAAFDLQGKSTGDAKTFFQPLPKSELPAIDWGRVRFSDWTEGYSHEPRRVERVLQSVSNRLWCSWLENSKKQPWVQRKCYREIPSIATGEHTPDVPYEWQTCGEIEAKSFDIPHCSFRVYHYAEPEESLRRSEVLPIVGYMRWRLSQFDYICHHTFPVLVVSIFRSKARILQAYHDGQRLHISKSRFVDFREPKRENYELFVRWIHGVPCGDTEAPLGIKGEEIDQVTSELIDDVLHRLFRTSQTSAAARRAV
ncbi:uncharacterized protein BO80DRAFT_494448 [Aspergillus ibericus CBS 121593]|uniref:Uncharacterized protein n=1 Tax=Aspergillus ibericus CBS 121593 TaxID=1448316 RepID=A0A395GY77_9EURO|nr:hypothetical protein BO80DRAFT_494448 [Aspergillus ibericus CBS 121593]RAL00035.1 hypothetical protein BO80DRAFT_494448 [Aspergillus ibericus CBS 121593]